MVGFISGDYEGVKLKSKKFVEICGLGETKRYLSFLVDKMEIGECCLTNVRFAVVLKNFKNFDVILNKNSFIKEHV